MLVLWEKLSKKLRMKSITLDKSHPLNETLPYSGRKRRATASACGKNGTPVRKKGTPPGPCGTALARYGTPLVSGGTRLEHCGELLGAAVHFRIVFVDFWSTTVHLHVRSVPCGHSAVPLWNTAASEIKVKISNEVKT